jgi:UDP-N-acetylmuramoyl-L-alanyl-D-glutamate--2,6-diaminopimelate ligase
LAPETIAAGIAQCAPCRGASSESTKASRSWWWWTTPIPTTRCERDCGGSRPDPKRIITLFGCGGDRDRAKRPLMGKAAAENSDFVVLTSDNPRSEDPLAIMNDALVGIRRVDRCSPTGRAGPRHRHRPRHQGGASRGDIVILAGKGHETYQVLKDKTIAFDDRAVAREVLRGFGYHREPK